MYLMIGFILLFSAFLMAYFVLNFKQNKFMEKEASCVINNFCEDNGELDDVWFVKRGFTVIEKNGETKFIKQTKLYNYSLLYYC